MTESDHGRDDQRAPGGVEPAFAAAGNSPPPHPYPGYGYPPPAKPSRAGWIVGGVAALVVVLGGGVAVGVVLGQTSGQPPKPTAPPVPVFSMNAVSNACDLVDPAPLTKWSPTPAGPPEYREVRPSVEGAGSLSCHIGYNNGDALNMAEILLDVEFTNGSAGPSYDNWKSFDLAKTGAGLESGPITGIGTQAYWHSETLGDLVTNTRYLLAVLDGNVSVRVRLNLSRDKDNSQVPRADLESVALAQIRNTLNKLKN